ncbi:MAG TPA: MFS transporter [Pseudonocardiaceae bacterium]|nr:MFS transporter [Pseudonocardiaceae bacterium]
MVALCLGFFMIMMDATVVNTALPVIGRELSASVSGLQWVVDGYTLVFACLLLSGGSLGDRLGARRVFLTGLVLFTAASAACGFAPTLAALNTARVAQGVGAALVLPTSLALINASFPDRERRVRAIGMWGGFGGVAAGLGPVVGGALTSAVGWRAVFYVNVPIGIVALLLTLAYVVAPRPKGRSRLDPLGQVLAVVTVAALAFGLIEGGARGWTTGPVLVAYAVTVVGALGFVVNEHRQADPMLPPRLFRVREFSGAIAVGAAINTGFYGQLFLMSLYLQHVRHFSPLLAGLALLPMPGATSIASTLAGRHNARRGPRGVMLVGLGVGALGLFAMFFTSATSPYWALLPAFLALGFGTGYTMPAATAAAIEAAPDRQAGTASGAFNASRQLGSTLGVAVFGALVASLGGILGALHVSVLVGGLAYAAGAVVTAIAVPRRNTTANSPVDSGS